MCPQGAFQLDVESGEFTDSEIIVMLGENGTGKTTFIRMLHGSLKPDDEATQIPQFRVSYKPQKISPSSQARWVSRATLSVHMHHTNQAGAAFCWDTWDGVVLGLTGSQFVLLLRCRNAED